MVSVRLAAFTALVGFASLWGSASLAQVYRIVGPDGKVTFSDRPPADGKASPAKTVPIVGGNGGGSSMASLPPELRTATTRFPVTIYTTADCAPCLSARNFLSSRGVPYTEKTVVTQDDAKALQNLSGEVRLPFATIGGQHVRGFAQSEWAQYLDAAGYPATSQLPGSWRNPAPTPLVAAQAVPAQASRAQAPAAQPATPVEAPQPSAPSPANPAGIRF